MICSSRSRRVQQTRRSSVHTDSSRMDSFMSLGSPLKQFTSCMSGKSASSKRGGKRSQSVRRSSFSRRKSVGIGRRRSLPGSSQKVPDSWLRVYQEELKKERKRQQANLAKKNAERSVRKTQFRSHHCLPKHTAPARKPAAAKDESFFGAFQGLTLDGLMGGTGAPAAASSSAAGDPCKVM
ncbi:hypothetical protein OJAV_G00115020 [Oryzias javanicus]|uniref:Uncharacterized protein n=1 Tax=Oryzias javanicus TaxID=123683 RepID=A0A3S2MUK1_ORYJA|nr:hypothetical protein OJAV_G00115020 [Oryzias javanicus]